MVNKSAYEDLMKYLEAAALVGLGLIGFLRELKRHADDGDEFWELFQLLRGNK